ncbi:MAG: adenylate/guanylate cyclase domain-containing protein [Gammaproteobacteria bacterium]
MDKTLPKLAVLYADVSGSTRLYEQHGDAIARTDLAHCISILQNTAAGLAGETLKTIGDEIMCAFAEPIKAALAATEMQATLRRAGESGAFKMGLLHIKIGWHYGPVIWRGDDLIGEAPVTAQQIIRLAKADEILTSRQAVETLPNPLFPELYLIDHLPAEAWDGELHVFKMPWEQSGDETQISSKPRMQGLPVEVALILDYAGHKVRVDPSNNACVIGRGRHVSLQVNGRLTSRQHAEVNLRHGRFSIRDESTNGTYIVLDDGTRKHLRREEDLLSGSGRLGFGSWPDDDPGGTVVFDCLN